MRTKPTAITDLPLAPEEDRRSRMIRYTIAMSIRLICFILAIVIPDWWRVIPLIGAVVLPYIAVVIANNAMRVRPRGVLRPGSVTRAAPDRDAA